MFMATTKEAVTDSVFKSLPLSWCVLSLLCLTEEDSDMLMSYVIVKCSHVWTGREEKGDSGGQAKGLKMVSWPWAWDQQEQKFASS